MIIGGIAVIARGVRRMTTDIDAVIRGDAIELDDLLPLLADHEITPRIDDAIAFARANYVLLLRHDPSKVDFDLSFGWTSSSTKRSPPEPPRPSAETRFPWHVPMTS